MKCGSGATSGSNQNKNYNKRKGKKDVYGSQAGAMGRAQGLGVPC
jgi:hypothetical protein